MRPLQTWIPLIGPSLGFADVARDMRRAFAEWEGEIRVWIVPDLEKPFRWSETRDGGDVRLLTVPGDRLECVDVYHIGENGHVFGLGDFGRFPNRNIEGLLDAWLALLQPNQIDRRPPWRVQINVPVGVGEDGVFFSPTELTVPTVPLTDSVLDLLSLRVPTGPAAVFPEAELAESLKRKFGVLEEVGRRDGLPLIGKVGSTEALFASAALATNHPLLEGLYTAGVSIDALHQCSRMTGVVKTALAATRARALREARDSAAPYISEGWSVQALSWFHTTAQEEGVSETIVGRGAKFGLNDARNIEEVRISDPWRRKMSEQIPIRRVWGPIGLFWALILERLEEAGAVMVCQRCGQPIRGTRRKKFCSRTENDKCFRKHRAAERRRQRGEARER